MSDLSQRNIRGITNLLKWSCMHIEVLSTVTVSWKNWVSSEGDESLKINNDGCDQSQIKKDSFAICWDKK